ncbi:4-hydroxythreonine-4-phosphate dehydrogenase [Pseudonocardia hierapolitana]|uniref:4-hydroxythreonine-4-phosphate dehydrogenase n=1 Tax=Pseudonocardia hierapolitana TaxID=1128676 RepID=A0A561SX30_9PSEU|nr:4-hydroxythreonine-4-phosphate dehydrogenase PdxA [Pseudonocardia hierapolitana]TWF79415.1 4-hydroxythreonine-4-phosphate dehydrogenase [Pseudonocardia hierapolitana]
MTTSQSAKPRVAVTLGDPAGIGPELVARLLADPGTTAAADIVLISDERELADAQADAGVEFSYGGPREPRLHDNGAARPGAFERKIATEAGGRWAMSNLRVALEMADAGDVDAIVFAPLNKSSLHLAGMREKDELRWFETILGAEAYTCELNVLPTIWTARVTSHVSIAEVADGITRENVLGAGRLLHTVLRDSGIAAPRIGVCALNPHAGESGRFGRHEIDVIAPAVAELRTEGVDAAGPFPSDTIFLRRDEFDGVLTMYHDQGQIAMKLLGFDGGVTMAGGLRVPICTPAHGTAFDLVGRRTASTGSIRNAFGLAARIGARRAARNSTVRHSA